MSLMSDLYCFVCKLEIKFYNHVLSQFSKIWFQIFYEIRFLDILNKKESHGTTPKLNPKKKDYKPDDYHLDFVVF